MYDIIKYIDIISHMTQNWIKPFNMILIYDLIQCYMIQIKSYAMTGNDMMIYMIKVCTL